MQDSSVGQVFHCIDACLTRNPFTMATLKFFLKSSNTMKRLNMTQQRKQFFSLFELRTSILVQEKTDEMQCLYCSVVFVDFKLHYNNTDMLRWSCRWRRCQWCVWVWVKVCVWFQSGDISDVPYIPLLRDYRPTFCVASFFFFPSSSWSLFILATVTWLIDRHTSPITSALLNWHSAQVVVFQKHGGNERKTWKVACEVETGAPWWEERGQHFLAQ